MSRKTSAAKQAAFLKAVAETGNQTIAAERAKVSRSWVVLHRSRDAAFDAAVREAVAQARAALYRASAEGEGALRPAGRWAFQDGEELVVRGTGGGAFRDGSGVAGGGGRVPKRAQIARARVKQWSPRAEATFLRRLGETCNVKAACAAAGLSVPGAYAHRRRWDDFARRWDEVLDEGMIRLELALMERFGNPLSDPEAPLDTPIREMTTSEALYMLEMHKRRVARELNAPGRRRRGPPPIEQVRASIQRKVEAIKRARKYGLMGAPGPGEARPDGGAGGEDGGGASGL